METEFDNILQIVRDKLEKVNRSVEGKIQATKLLGILRPMITANCRSISKAKETGVNTGINLDGKQHILHQLVLIYVDCSFRGSIVGLPTTEEAFYLKNPQIKELIQMQLNEK